MNTAVTIAVILEDEQIKPIINCSQIVSISNFTSNRLSDFQMSFFRIRYDKYHSNFSVLLCYIFRGCKLNMTECRCASEK